MKMKNWSVHAPAVQNLRVQLHQGLPSKQSPVQHTQIWTFYKIIDFDNFIIILIL